MSFDDRRGFVLPATIGALVIIAIMVTAGFFVARQELRVAVAGSHATMAVNIAQAGANDVMARWGAYGMSDIPVWGERTVTGTMAQGTWEVTVANRDNSIYVLTATGTVTEGGELWAGATRSIGVVTKRSVAARIDPIAALTTRGRTTVKGTALVDGHNLTPPAWLPYCGGVAPDDAIGILTNDESLVTTNSASALVDGAPPVDEDTAVADETFTQFGDMDWDDLTALARAEGKDVTSLGRSISVVEPATDLDGQCDEARLDNWGDTLPTAPCGAHFPLIYHRGPTLTIQGGGYGQGVLLVDGKLDLRGNFLFYGLIIVQGDVSAQGAGNRVVGAVMASNGVAVDQTITGAAEIKYSRCAVHRAVLGNPSLSRVRPLRQRSWMDLTSVAN